MNPVINESRMKIRKDQKIFLWLMIISCIATYISAFSLYRFPGERTVMTLFMAICGFSYIAGMLEKRNISICISFVALSLFGMILPIINQTLPSTNSLMGIMFGAFFILLKNEYKLFVFDKVIFVISFILVFGLVEFYIYNIFHVGIRLGVVQRGETHFFFNHFLFNIIKIDGDRFQSICNEPASVGGFCGFMLFLLDEIKEYRKHFFICLFAGISSLSLTFIAFLCMYAVWICSRFKVRTVIGTVLGLVLIVTLAGSKIEHYIVDRYQSGDYDDRASEAFMDKYDDYLKSSDVWFGMGEGAVKEIDEEGATVGFRREIYEIGIVGVFIIFLAFSLPYFKLSPTNKFTFCFFAVNCVSYYSSSGIYSPLRLMMIFSIPAILGLKISKIQKN